MKKGIFFIAIGSILIILSIIFAVIGNYEYDNQIKSYWELADKSSTVERKAENIDKFVEALEKTNLKGKHNAIWLKTPNNSWDYNLEALKTLQQRLHEIKDMDITSFEYQTAIQQITQQEQGKAGEMIGVFKSIWWKEKNIILWDWVGLIQVLSCLGLIVTGIVIRTNEWYNS